MRILIVFLGLLSLTPVSLADGDDQNALKVTVGRSLRLGEMERADEVDLVVSPTGAVAAFVPTVEWVGREGQLRMAYRVSRDGGKTWTGQFEAPAPNPNGPVVGVAQTVAEVPRGTIKIIGHWQHMIRPPTFFVGRFARFSDDMSRYQVEGLRAEMKEAITLIKEEKGVGHKTEKVQPIYDRGQLVRLSEYELILALHGKFRDDKGPRAFTIRSLDAGRLWGYLSTIGHGDASGAGRSSGYSEPSIALLPSGKLLAVLRTNGDDSKPFQPLSVSWSEDRGAHWTKPKPTTPPLLSVSPVVVVLDDGTVACAHGLPGLGVSFSVDGGQTWSQYQALPEVSTEHVTGRIDIVKIGPQKLLALAGVGPGGTRVFPITVERNRAAQ